MIFLALDIEECTVFIFISKSSDISPAEQFSTKDRYAISLNAGERALMFSTISSYASSDKVRHVFLA